MDAKHPQDEETPTSGRDGCKVDVSRRRFTRAGLSGSVVLGSLASKPVLGATMNHCTVSGQASGNLSRLAEDVSCDIGEPPSYWLAAQTWPSPFVKGTPPSKQCAFTGNVSSGVPRAKGTDFNGFTPGAGVPELADSFFNEPTGTGSDQACTVTLTLTSNPATMLQVLGSMDLHQDLYLGGVVVASLLNAASLGSTYPVTTHTIIAMFNAIFGGVEYPVTYTKSWDRARVILYLESLYQYTPLPAPAPRA